MNQGLIDQSTIAVLLNSFLCVHMWVYYLICFFIAGLGYGLRSKSAPVGNGLAAIGALVAVILMISDFAKEFSGSNQVDRYQGVVGYMMGQNFLRMVPEKSGEVALIFPPDEAYSTEALDSLFDTFARVLMPFGGLKIKDASLEVDADDARNGQIPAAVFNQALADFPNAIAYVSFAGAPSDDSSLNVWESDGDIPAKPFFVYDPAGTENWRKPLENGKIALVIRPKPGVDRGGDKVAGPPNEIFDKYFEYVRK